MRSMNVRVDADVRLTGTVKVGPLRFGSVNDPSDEQCEDYVHVDPWETLDLAHLGLEGTGRHVSISTDWKEYEEKHGIERYEPLRNIHITHLPEYDSHDDVCLLP